VRRYVPELKGLDKKYIYEPWKAPLADQKKAGVRIRGDGKAEADGLYPKPMFDFSERRKICLDGIKKAYEVGLYVNDPDVIKGTWRRLFDDAAEDPTEGKRFEDTMGDGLGNDEKVEDQLEGPAENDGGVAEVGGGAKAQGGEKKGSDRNAKTTKRKGGQETLDSHIKRSKR
jgi:cryptochrome